MRFCERPFTHVYLAPNGEVWPCNWMHYVIGNLYEQNLDEIWVSKAAQRARESILDGSFAFCRKTSCPRCERGALPDLSEDELKEKSIPTDLPIMITIANDKICNIACTTCRQGIYCAQEGEREKIDAVLKHMLPYASQAMYVDMNGNGEFLANPSFLKFLESLRPKRQDCRFNFETNGVLFDETHWERFSHLKDCQISVTVTLNSLRREIYQHLSGGFDKIDEVRRNIEFLSKLRREHQINELKVTMVVQECNFQEVPEYIRVFTETEEYAVDQIILKPVYKWFGMDEETYWFKNILNPLHPYHKEYLKVLENDCWKEPKVYDWGCHNLREARPHPLNQEKLYNRLLLNIYENSQGLKPQEFLRGCLAQFANRRIAVYGDSEMAGAMLSLLRKAGINVVLQLTWFENAQVDIPKVAMQEFRPEMTDAVLLLDFYDKQNLERNLRSLHFKGDIVTLEDVIKGKDREN